MAAMTVKRARRWAVGCPIIAGLGAFAAYGLGLAWPAFYFDEPTMYNTGSWYAALGVVFVGYSGAAAWVSGAVRRRPVATGAVVLWGMAFGGWFSYATLRLTYVLFQAVPIVDDLGGGRLWQRMLGLALGIAIGGAGTALVLWWLTRERWILWCNLAIASAAAALAPVECLWEFGLVLVTVLWHGATAAVLGQWVVREVRRRSEGTVCAECGYSLEGLPGPRCPECGTEVRRDVRQGEADAMGTS